MAPLISIRRPPRNIIGFTKFPEPTPFHDAKGTKRFPLQPGITGKAEFSKDGCYRYWLSRQRQKGEGYILWIGHNPSTAAGDIDDPTIRREMEFSWNAGARRMVKCNVLDFCATHLKDLENRNYRKNMPAFSEGNFERINLYAKNATQIVLCYGAIKNCWDNERRRTLLAVTPYIDKVVCLGRTQSNHPRHPLYVKGDTPFESFL